MKMVEYSLMEKLSGDFLNQNVAVTGICTELYYNDGGFILPARLSANLWLENGDNLTLEAWKHIMVHTWRDLNELDLDVTLLQASGEIGREINVYGKLSKKRDIYLLKVHDVQYIGSYGDFRSELSERIKNIEEILRDFTR